MTWWASSSADELRSPLPPPKTEPHAALLEQSPRRGHHSLIPPLYNAILLW